MTVREHRAQPATIDRIVEHFQDLDEMTAKHTELGDLLGRGLLTMPQGNRLELALGKFIAVIDRINYEHGGAA